MIQEGASLDKGPTRLGHLAPVHRQHTVYEDTARQRQACALKHRWPKQRVEVNDILPNHVDDFCVIATPELIEGETFLLGVLRGCGDVSNGRVEPDIEVLIFTTWDGETKVRPITCDVPVTQTIFQPSLDKLARRILKSTGLFDPTFQKLLEVAKTHKDVLCLLFHRGITTQRALRLFQLICGVCSVTIFTDIAVLLGRFTEGTGPT